MFEYHTTIKLHDTDAAGLLFFSNQFKFMHDAYEEMIAGWGFGFRTLLLERDYFLPIVHAEADYKASLFVGDQITVQVFVDHIGTTSFSFRYVILKADRTQVGGGKTVHVTMNKESKTKIPLPDEVRSVLKQYA